MERKWWTLIAVSIAIFMLLLDITVVNVALPEIQHRAGLLLQRSAVGRQRLLPDPRRLPVHLRGGRRPDRRRRVFVIGLIVFTGASAGLQAVHLGPDAEPRAGGAGGRRGDDVRHLAGPDRGGVPRQGAGTAFGVFGGVIGAAVAVGPLSAG